MVKFLKTFLKLSIHACQHQALYCGVVIHFSDIDVLIVLLCILYGSWWKRFYENIVLLSNFEDKPKLRNQSAWLPLFVASTYFSIIGPKLKALLLRAISLQQYKQIDLDMVQN